jgi:hypothetical protein
MRPETEVCSYSSASGKLLAQPARSVRLRAARGVISRSIRPPRWMSRRQKRIWIETLADAPADVLRRINRLFFMQWVELAATWEHAARAQIKRRAPIAGLGARSKRRSGSLGSFIPVTGERNATETVMI